MSRALIFLCACVCGVPSARGNEPSGNKPSVNEVEIRAAVSRSLPLLERTAREFTVQRECFSCHHQTHPLLALTLARGKGLAVNEDEVKRQVDRTARFLGNNEERYREGKGTGGQADTAGNGLWALAVGGYAPDSMTEAVAEYLLLRHNDRDFWQRTSQRPPTQASHFTTTFLAIQGLSKYAAPAQKERADDRIERARQWLVSTAAKDTEDHVFRLRGLHSVGADAKQLAEAADLLWARQREDGGWSQLDDMGSDAYATGTALAALAQSGGAAVSDSRYQLGLRFLVDAQLDDGSWYVATRSKAVQEYFESDFPHGLDQFISVSATSWSVVALAMVLPDAEPIRSSEDELSSP